MARTDLRGGSEIIVINEPFVSRTRVSATGKASSRTTIEIRSEPILHDFNDRRLGEGPSAAILGVLQERMRGITAPASDGTLVWRAAADRAFNTSPRPRWVARRFGGGRTGDTPPTDSTRLFNHSGRLAGGLFVRENATDKSWTVNVPANRLNPETFSPGEFEAMLGKLSALVPELRDPAMLLRSADVRQAIGESIEQLIAKATDATRLKQRQLAAAVLRTVGFGRVASLVGP